MRGCLMKYRLGLDMGTNSIGYAIVSLDENDNPKELIDLGVRIFKDGRNPKSGQPLAVQRREARGMRRQRDRRIQRIHNVYQALYSQELISDDPKERALMIQKDPYELRTRALDSELSKLELGRALFHLGTRRGFKSNRITDASEEEKSSNMSKKMSQADKMSNLRVEMANNNCRTVGEYLHSRLENGLGARFRGGDFNCYPSRELYYEEFILIKERQMNLYCDVDWDRIENAIFNQRGLKKQEKGKCQFFTNEDRAYSAIPSSHTFRILSEVNNLKFMDEIGATVTLNDEEKDKLVCALQKCKTMSFDAVRKLLSIKTKFNLESDKRKKLIGNETACDMRKSDCFGDFWDTISVEEQDRIVEVLLESETDEEILNYLKKYNLSSNQVNTLLRLKLGRKMSNLSSRFMRECAKIMEKEHIRYDEAVSKMDLHHSYNPITDIVGALPYYGQVLTGSVMSAHPEADENNPEYKYGKIANPTVHVALNQLRKVTNALIERYGNPEQIVVELARDISNSAEKRKEIVKEQTANQKENERIKKEIKEIANISNPTAWDVKKYKLWEELSKDSITRRCVYCGEVIPASKLFTKEIEIEHILPYSRSMLDSMSNLTVAHVSCNSKKKEHTPYEAFSSNPTGFIWTEILNRAESLPQAKRRKFAKDAIDELEKDGNFITRQLNDTRFLAKASKDYLACVCKQNNIWVIPGYMTSVLRDRWRLNTLLNCNDDPHFKNRSDHRHHSIDALVIALTDHSMIQNMAKLNANCRVDRRMVPDFPFSLETVKDKLIKLIVSHKQEHGFQGRIFKETATGLRLVKKVIPLKNLKEDDINNDLLVNKIAQEKIKASLDQGVPFVTIKKQLMNASKQTQGVDDPLIEIFDRVWITRVNLVDLSKKDIEDDRVFNERLAKRIKESTIDVLNDKKDLAERLAQLSNKWGIRRVRYVPFTQEFVKINSVPNKWYEKDGVHCATIWRIPQKSGKHIYQGQFISYQEAYDHESGKLKEYPKPHPAAKKLMTLYKEDIICICPNDGTKPYLARIASYSATDNRLDIRPLNAANSIPDWTKDTNRFLCNDLIRWGKVTAVNNYVSINVLFSQNRINLVKVTPDGRIVQSR